MPGTVVFKPIEANFSHEGHRITHIQPVCSITVGSQKQEGGLSRKEAGVHAQWDDSIILNRTDDNCLVELKEKDCLIPNDTLGSFRVNLKDLDSQGKISKWFTIMHQGDPVGEMLLEASTDSAESTQWAKQDTLCSTIVSNDQPSKIIVNDLTTKQENQSQGGLNANQADLQSLFNKTNEPLIEESFQLKKISQVPETVHNNTGFRELINETSQNPSLNQGFVSKQGDSL